MTEDQLLTFLVLGMLIAAVGVMLLYRAGHHAVEDDPDRYQTRTDGKDRSLRGKRRRRARQGRL